MSGVDGLPPSEAFRRRLESEYPRDEVHCHDCAETGWNLAIRFLGQFLEITDARDWSVEGDITVGHGEIVTIQFREGADFRPLHEELRRTKALRREGN